VADVEIKVGGRRYPMYCRDGDEAHLARLAGLVDGKAEQARGASGNLSEINQLLFAAIFLADELDELKRRGPAAKPSAAAETDEPAARALESLALRLENLAQKLAPGTSTS
jgi:cell division protein ZapA